MNVTDLSLAPFEPAWLDLLLRWRDEPLMRRFNPVDVLSREDALARFTSEGTSLVDLTAHTSWRWCVLRAGVPIGTVSLRNVNLRMGTAELGYGIAQSLHGQGLGRAAVALAVGRIFRETRLRRLCALVHGENVASQRLLLGLGFVREGVLREHFLIEGAPADEVAFGILRAEWEARSAG